MLIDCADVVLRGKPKAGKGSPKVPACPLARVYEGHACWQPQRQMLEQT